MKNTSEQVIKKSSASLSLQCCIKLSNLFKMKLYLLLCLIAIIFSVVEPSQSSDSENVFFDSGSSDFGEDLAQSASELVSSSDQSGIYQRVKSYRPYLKKAILKEQASEETSRQKREPNVRKPLLFKRQANVRKPILLLNDPLPLNERSVRPTESEFTLPSRPESLSRSIPFPEEDNKLDDEIGFRSDRARRPILVKP